MKKLTRRRPSSSLLQREIPTCRIRRVRGSPQHADDARRSSAGDGVLHQPAV